MPLVISNSPTLMFQVVFVRHGISLWPTRFTGWTDIDIAPEGIQETYSYGKRLKEAGYCFDVGFTSKLTRGIKTLWTVLDAMGLTWIPVHLAWQLNERHYGALQGLNKAETVKQYGESQVAVWRRSYDIRPPEVDIKDPRHPIHDPRYAGVDPKLLPASECLKDTYARAVPYWRKVIAPEVKKGARVIVSAHGNSIRALVKHFDNLSDEEVTSLNIPYCIPLIYEFDAEMNPVKHYYLASDEEVSRVIASIKNQTKQKS